jgi:hypothetical protein
VLDGVLTSATIRLNRRTVMPLSSPSTSANRVAPSAEVGPPPDQGSLGEDQV